VGNTNYVWFRFNKNNKFEIINKNKKYINDLFLNTKIKEFKCVGRTALKKEIEEIINYLKNNNNKIKELNIFYIDEKSINKIKKRLKEENFNINIENISKEKNTEVTNKTIIMFKLIEKLANGEDLSADIIENKEFLDDLEIQYDDKYPTSKTLYRYLEDIKNLYGDLIEVDYIKKNDTKRNYYRMISKADIFQEIIAKKDDISLILEVMQHFDKDTMIR
jgi:hypothetical protein